MKESSFNYEKLIECGKGILFGKGNAQLPLPPMLMFDRITNINETGGKFFKGEVSWSFSILKFFSNIVIFI